MRRKPFSIDLQSSLDLDKTVANWTLRLKENQAGKFFVDSSCIGCEVCVLQNSQFFKMLEPKINIADLAAGTIVEIPEAEANSIYGKAIVYNQPTLEAECNEVRETMLICPTDSIGEKE